MSAQALMQPDADRLGQRNFSHLSSLIFDRVGIKMPATKLTMLEGRLRRRMRETGCATLDGYCESFFGAGIDADEIEHLINAVTTNKTDFFREPKHFDYLAGTVLPSIAATGQRTVRAWSAACSTGAEPYTMAMVLDDFARRERGPSFGILATDIDTDVLETARKGIYPAGFVDPVPPALRARYVMQSRRAGSADVRVAPALRSTIGFARLNLMDPHYPVGEPMDLIFCRNVLIYFDQPTQRQVVSRLHDCLRPGGHLFLGHSETISGFDLPLVPVANTVFRRN